MACSEPLTATMTDIYRAVDLQNFQFTPRCSPFNWRLLHGLDVDTLVRLNDAKKLETVIPALQQGSIDAEGVLSNHNYVQLFRLVQLAVEHLWQMRESHAKLYPAYKVAVEAAANWKSAAASYLDVGGQLLAQLQSEEGAVLTKQLLTEVAVAREALEKADAAYNKALDKLEAEDAAARCHSLRQQRLEISWRLVFGVDVQHMLFTGSVSQLEQLLPQVAYGNIMAENPVALTPAHFRQLLMLGQACLDYLHAICCATSKVLEQQVTQLATGSIHIPELTTACEDLRAALATALSSSIKVLKAGLPAPASPARAVHIQATGRPATALAVASATAQCHSPSCHHVAHLEMTGHHQNAAAAGSKASASSCGHCCSGVCICQSPHVGCMHCGSGAALGCCCAGAHPGGSAAAGRAEASALLSGRLFDVGLTPSTNKLQLRMEQLDRELRHERECTQGMRQALEEVTAMLQDLPSPNQQQQQPQQQHKQKHSRPAPVKTQQQQQQQAQPQPHTVNVPVTISMTGQGGRGQQESPPVSPGTAKDPNGAVRVLINEDTIRARERSAAGQQLSEHISDVIMGHQLGRRSPNGSQAGGARTKTSNSVHVGGPFVTVRSIPSTNGRTLWRTGTYTGSQVARFEGEAGTAGDFASGPVRGWRYSRSPTAYSSRQGVFSAKETLTASMHRGHGDAYPDVGPGAGGDAGLQPGTGVGLGDFMKQQLLVQQEQQQGSSGGPTSGPAAAHSSSAQAAADLMLLQGQELELQEHTQRPVDPKKQMQQELFKEAAAGGFRKLLRSMSPKHMFGRPSSASVKGTGTPEAPSGRSPGPAGVSRGPNGASSAAGGAGGQLQWPLLTPAGGSGAWSAASSPETSPTRSGRSFSASTAAKAAEELGLSAAKSPLAPPGQFSPLKASIVAHT